MTHTSRHAIRCSYIGVGAGDVSGDGRRQEMESLCGGYSRNLGDPSYSHGVNVGGYSNGVDSPGVGAGDGANGARRSGCRREES